MLKRFAELFTGAARSEVAQEVERVQLATCVILLEAATVGQEFTDTEKDHIVEVLKNRFALNENEAADLMREAHEIRQESHDLFRFTTLINQNFSHAEKIEIIEEVWRIIYSDGVLDGHEDHFAHKLRNLLNLNHPQMIEAKLKILEERRGQS